MEFQKKQVWQWLCAAGLIFILPNIIFWCIQPKVFLIRGVFVLEYFLIACLYPFINRRLFVVLWVLFAIYDMVAAASSVFFMDFFEILHALVKIPDVPFTSILQWAGLLLLFVLLVVGYVRVMTRYNRSYQFLTIRFMWLPIVFCLVIDFFNGQGPLRRYSVTLFHFNGNIVSAPSWSFANAVKDVLTRKNDQQNNVEYIGSVSKKIFTGEPDSIAAKKEILVLVESWGLLKNKELEEEVAKPLYALVGEKGYSISAGVTNYKYTTQAGEFREITGYMFHYYQAYDDWVKKNSLFLKKQQEGYRVIGLHGYSSAFYERNKTWPAFGVQDMYFAEQFRQLSMPLCGNAYFSGICDSAINTWLFNSMQQQPERKEFYYWVTLGTHLPLIAIHDNAFNRFAEKWKSQGIPETVLQLAYQHQLLFVDIASKLRNLPVANWHIALIGDHAPPFISPAERNQYSSTQVPYLDIRPVH